MNSRGGVNRSRRYQLRLDPALASELETYAVANGLRRGTALRSLVTRSLEAEHRNGRAPADSPAALAGLTAAEHAVLMVASVLPEGQRRMRELAPQATVAAEERLAVFRESGQ